MYAEQQQSAALNPFEPTRFVGVVGQVKTSAVEVALDLERHIPDAPFGVRVGDYLLVEAGKCVIMGQVIDIRLPEMASPTDRPDFQIGIVNLMTTIELEYGTITPGVLNRPRPGDRVFYASGSFVKLVIEAKNGEASKDQVTLSYAHLLDSQLSPLRFTPEMLFGRHCAIVGTTGGGKSWSVARLVEQCAQHKSKVILFDATGEYGSLGGPVLHVYLGSHPAPTPDMREVVLPYYQLNENDLFAIFRPTGQSQATKLRAAIKTLKLVKVSPNLALDGLVVKANRSKDQFDAEYGRHIDTVENPTADFDMSKLVRQIQNECVFPTRSALEPHYWGDVNGAEQSQCVPMLNRISDMIQSSNLAPIFQPMKKPSLLDVIERFLEHKDFRVLCISLQHLSFMYHAREIIANAAGRYLLGLSRLERFVHCPLLVLVDEAHQFLNQELEQDAGYPLDSFGLIAKEGRKYALNICIATQRPRDIPESVLSQMGTLIVHRLINDRDRAVVERAAGSVDKNTLSMLPALAPGQAMILGVDFPVPILAQVERPTCPPRSEGPRYQKFWHDPGL